MSDFSGKQRLARDEEDGGGPPSGARERPKGDEGGQCEYTVDCVVWFDCLLSDCLVV